MNSIVKDRYVRSFVRHAGAGYLLASHGVVAGSGLVFWAIAARTAGAAAVGGAAAAIAVALLASTVCQFGLPQSVLRFGRHVADLEQLAGSALALLWASTLVGGLLGAALLHLLAGDTAEVSNGLSWVMIPLGAAGVGQMTLLWHMAASADCPAVPLFGSLVEAGCKVVFVSVFGQHVDGGGGVLLAWGASVIVGAAVGAWFILPRMTGLRLVPREPSRLVLRTIARFSLATHLGDLVIFTPTTGVLGWLIPLIVVARFGAVTGGVFYVAWAVAGALNAIPFAIAMSTVGHGEHYRPGRGALVLGAVAVVPAASVFFLAPLILAALSPAHVSSGVPLLRALAAASVVAAITAALSAQLKLRGRLGALRSTGAVVALPLTLAAALFPVEWGTLPLAAVWGTVLAAAALLALATLVPGREILPTDRLGDSQVEFSLGPGGGRT